MEWYETCDQEDGNVSASVSLGCPRLGSSNCWKTTNCWKTVGRGPQVGFVQYID